MSNEFITRLDAILEKESGLKVAQVAMGLKNTVSNYLRTREFTSSMPKSIRPTKALPAPPGFKDFKANLADYKVSSPQVAEMEHAFLRLQFEAEGVVKTAVENERKKIGELNDLCGQLSIDVTEEVKEAELRLADVIRLLKDGNPESTKRHWADYTMHLSAIQEKLGSAVPKDIIKVVNKLIKGERVKLNEVDLEDLKSIKDTPISKQITLSLGKGA